MTASNPNISLQQRLQHWSGILASLLIALALLVLMGWAFNMEFFKRPIPGLVAMNPTTALCMLATGLLGYGPAGLRTKRLGWLLASLPFVVGMVRLSDVISGHDSGIDSILFASKLHEEIAPFINNGMAPNTAFCFSILGVALLLWKEGSRLSLKILVYCSTLVGFIALLATIGYLYKLKEFYDLLSFIRMSVYTAVGFFAGFPHAAFLPIPTPAICRWSAAPMRAAPAHAFLYPHPSAYSCCWVISVST